MEKNAKKLVLLDGNALIHRSYHALPPLMTRKGELVNAVYGFASTVLSVLEKFKPDYIAASFDLPAATFRHKEYAQYKATRSKAPDDLYAQIPRVKELTEILGIPIYEMEGFEADDVIGTLSEQAGKLGDIETIIVTGDADALQLVDKKTKVFTMRRGLNDTVLYDEERVVQKYGFTARQIPDFKGLRGDSSDNIPGVKGIGEKTATQLLLSYETLEGVYQHSEEIKPAIREKLLRDKMQAILSKRLGTIERHVPLEIDLDKCATHTFERERVVSFFRELNFFSLLKRLPTTSQNLVKSSKKKIDPMEEKYEMIEESNAEKIFREIKESVRFGFALDLKDHEMKAVAFSRDAGRAWYAPWNTQEKNIRSVFENMTQRAIGYDVKNAIKCFHRNNVKFNARYEDVLLSAYLLNPGASMNFNQIVLEALGDEMKYIGKPRQMTLLDSNAEEEDVFIACEMADLVLKIQGVHRERFNEIAKTQEKKRTLVDVLENIELPLVPILADMEEVGMKLNPLVLVGISETVDKSIHSLERALHKLAGTQYNINSTQQTAEVLFERLKISNKNIKKTKTGYSTATSELEKIRQEHPIIEKIEEYRELFKLKTTYLDVLPSLVDNTNRIHTTFNQAVTTTGRLSSTDPNLQNIPIRTDIGQLIRTAFIAEKGKLLVSADYSQIDLRCAAHVSGDKKLIEAFHRNDDIHTITAAELNHITPSQVTQKMRRAAKTLNFGVLYGMGTFGFMRAAGVTRDEAQKFIQEYMERFSGVADYIRRTKEVAKEKGFVETLFGRRRYVPEINSSNFQVVSSAERMAVNMPIQGLTADIMKLAMIAANGILAQYVGKAKMILQIHDELLFEVDLNDVERFMSEVKRAMESVCVLSVPLVVDVKSGENWGEL